MIKGNISKILTKLKPQIEKGLFDGVTINSYTSKSDFMDKQGNNQEQTPACGTITLDLIFKDKTDEERFQKIVSTIRANLKKENES